MRPNCREPVRHKLTNPELATVWPPDTRSGVRETGRAATIALAIAATIGVVGGWPIYRDWSAQRATALAAQQLDGALDRLLAAPAGDPLPVGTVQHGQELFASACAACHKADGTGMPGLGKDLVHSTFVAALGNDDLRRFIAEGRAANAPDNTTKMPMPPRGGRDDLADADLADLVVYLRGLQDPRRMPEGAPTAAAAAPRTFRSRRQS